MRKIFISIILTLALTEQSHGKEQNVAETLRAATIVFRHGDRNPIKPYPGDPYANESIYWPEGYGVMTRRGKIRLFNLGRFIRQRYPTFQRSNVKIYSSDTNRTIISAMANLAGFYGQNRSFLKHLDTYNPNGFGIQVIPKIDDDFIMIPRNNCLKYMQLQDEYYQKANPYSEFKNALEELSVHTGLNFTENKLAIVLTADTIIIQKSRNLKQPDWAELLYQQGIFHELQSTFFKLLMPTFEQKKLYAGAMVRRLLENIDDTIIKLEKNGGGANFQNEFLQITTISGHDSTIAAWLIVLQSYDNNRPHYGSALFFEIYEIINARLEKDDRYIMKVFYKNDTEMDPHQLSLPGCPNPCKYSSFKQLLQPLVIEDRVKACELLQTKEEKQDYLEPQTQNTSNPNTTKSKILRQNTSAAGTFLFENCYILTWILGFGYLSLCNTVV